MDGPTEEELYDDYLDACLSGAAEAPESFFRAHPQMTKDMRSRIEAAFALAQSQSTEQRATAGGSLPFDQLGGYRLVKRLGIGGMGSVYLAEQESLGRRVALKVIRSELRESETILRRFEREAKAVARLRHPNIVNVYEFGRDRGAHYIAMELVPGEPLDAALRDAAPPPEQILDWCAQLARALAYAHQEGIVHRDVKPQNVMITPSGRPVLLDFGVARITGTELTRLTQDFAGTPHYAAPEQLVDGPDDVDGRTDVYALGVTLYEALTGRLPFEGGRLDELLLRIVRDDPPRPRKLNPGLSLDVETVVLKAMEKKPARRYASATAFAEDIQRILDVRPVQARRPGLATGVRKWVRRRPVAATVLASIFVVLCAIAGLAVHSVLKDRERARDLVGEARALVADLRETRLGMEAEEKRVRRQETELESRYHAPEEIRAFDAAKDSVDRKRIERASDVHRISALLDEAKGLHSEVGGVTETRAALFNERLEAARVSGETTLEAFSRRELARIDPEGTTRATLGARGQLTVTSEPPGADIYLFRFRNLREFDPNGERRLVPVPVLPAGEALPAGLAPGQHALRVVRGADKMAEGDLILSVAGQPVFGSVFAAVEGTRIRRGDRVLRADDRPVRSLWDVDPKRLEEVRGVTFEGAGGTYTVLEADRGGVGFTDARGIAEMGGYPARVQGSGGVRDVTLPRGLGLRPTAAPRHLVDACRIGRTPLRTPQELEAGSYVVVLRLAGHEVLVLPAVLRAREQTDLRAGLNPLGTTPDGFVFVSGPAGVGTGAARPENDHAFWIQEREITNGEFLAFLNDREGWEGTGALDDWIKVDQDLDPPFARAQIAAQIVRKWSGGGYRLWHDGVRHLPVLNVTWRTAAAYAVWRGARDGGTYALPTLGEWIRAAGADGRRFVFGNDFRPAWCSSNFSRPGPSAYEPGMRYPVDESLLGVYDMTGGGMEWLDHPWGPTENQERQFTGGSAGHADSEAFRIGGGGGARVETRFGSTGFRLVLRKRPAKKK